MAITFGVLIDADHILAVPEYVSNNGLAAILKPTWDDGTGLVWRSVFHEPMGFFIVAPLAIGWRFMLPLLFWSSHVATDYLQAETLEHSAIVESVFLVVVCGGIVAVQYSRWRALRPESDFKDYVTHLLATVKDYVLGRGAVISRR